jgi:putative phosphoribosyl transferase
MNRFKNRVEAGQALARALAEYSGRRDVTVLALPRGGVPVGYEVAEALGAPLDVFVVRKLGVPGHEELAMGAIASGGVRVPNEDVVGPFRLSARDIDRVAAREELELSRREREYRGGVAPAEVEGRTVILVDDGLATGASMRAAVKALRQRRPSWLVVAVPVGAPSTCAVFEAEADHVVCARTPDPFYAVGQWYEDFRQTSDEEVRDLVAHARHRMAQV